MSDVKEAEAEKERWKRMDVRRNREMSGIKDGKRRGRDGKEWTLE